MCPNTQQAVAVGNANEIARDSHASRVLTEAVVRAAQLLSINDTQLGRILGLSQPTASRMRAGSRLLPVHSPDWQLGALFVRLYRSLDALVGGDDSKAGQWLRADNIHLNGVPLERIQNIEGLTDVVRYLDAMRGRL